MKRADLWKLHDVRWIQCAIGLALALIFGGCATTPPPLKGSPDLLNFLSDGKTTRTEAKFSLELVFDDAGILRKHSLVEVNK